MFDKLLAQLEQQELNRRTFVAPLEDVLNTTWETVDFGRPSQHINLGNEFTLSKHAYWQLAKHMNHWISGKSIPPKYHWAMPEVLATTMPEHVREQVAGRQRSNKRAHNNYTFVIHGDRITAIMSSNYVDYSNKQLVEDFIAECDSHNLTPKSVSYRFYDEYCDRLTMVPIFDTYEHEHSIYGAGLMLANSQNGTVGLHIIPVVKSTVCDNSIVSFFARFHRHDSGIEEFAQNQLAMTPELINLANDTYHQYNAAIDVYVADMPNVLDWLKAKFKLSKAHTERLTKGLTSERDDVEDTLFSLVSGLTYLANMFGEQSKAEELQLLLYAGRLLGLSDQEEVTLAELDI